MLSCCGPYHRTTLLKCEAMIVLFCYPCWSEIGAAMYASYHSRIGMGSC